MDKPQKIPIKKRIAAIAQVAHISAKASPLAVSLKIADAIISSLLPIATTYFAARTTTSLAEAYAGNPDAGSEAILFVLLTAGLGVVSLAWNSVSSYVAEITRYKIDAEMNDRLLDHFLLLEFWQYDDKETVDLFDKARQFARFFGYVFDSLSRILQNLITVVLSLGALAFVNVWIAVIILVVMLPGVIVQYRLSRMQTKHWNDTIGVRRLGRALEGRLLDPQAIAEIRLYGLAKRFISLMRSNRDKDERARISFERKYIGKRLLSDALEAVAEAGVLLYTVLQIIAREQPIGQFIYVQQITSRTLSAVGGLISTVNSIDEDIANLFDYQRFMDLPVQSGSRGLLKNAPQLIEVKNVSFAYPGSKVNVLNDVSMTIRCGTHVAIVGENGAGKSTLIKLLLGMYTPTRGSILVDGVELSEIAPDSWHAYVAVLQQDFQRYDFMTAHENILLGKDVDGPAHDRQRAVAKAASKAEADSFIDKLPKQYDTFLNNWLTHEDGTKGVDLSGGQWQRLALARNFYRDSSIIILDEPTSAIDALAESRIFKELFSDSSRTVIAISHRLSTVERADVIYMLQDGAVVETGTYTQLIQNKQQFYTMFESQIIGK